MTDTGVCRATRSNFQLYCIINLCSFELCKSSLFYGNGPILLVDGDIVNVVALDLVHSSLQKQNLIFARFFQATLLYITVGLTISNKNVELNNLSDKFSESCVMLNKTTKANEFFYLNPVQ